MVWNKTLAIFISMALLLLTAIAVFCTASGWAYWPERLSHFQLQYWLGAVLLTLLLLLLRRRNPILIGLFCLAILSTYILNWYIPSTGQADPFMKVMFSNVWNYNQRYEDVLNEVRTEKPDIASFAEVSPVWVQQLDRLKDILPYRTDYRSGTIIYSKISLADTEVINQSSLFFETVIIRNLAQNGRKFTLVATHPPSPPSRDLFRLRNDHLEKLGLYLEKSQDNLIVMGDFNTSPWSPYYRQFVDRTRLTNARQGFGLYPTWSKLRVRNMPELLQPFLSVPIDHIFTRSGNMKLRSIGFHTGHDVGSDHLPIVAEIGTVDS
jgi:endonuclease/exonuclease/phosphatase (EEP) superfamily protein YafD